MLREAVIGTVNNPLFILFIEVKPLGCKCCKKIMVNCMPPKFGNVFHTYDIRFEFVDETSKLVEQGPFWIILIVKTLGIF